MKRKSALVGLFTAAATVMPAHAVDRWFFGSAATSAWGTNWFTNYERTGSIPGPMNDGDDLYLASQGAINVGFQTVKFASGSNNYGGKLGGLFVDSRMTQNIEINGNGSFVFFAGQWIPAKLNGFGSRGVNISSPTTLTITSSTPVFNEGYWNVLNASATVVLNAPYDLVTPIYKRGPGVLRLQGAGGRIRAVYLDGGVLELAHINALNSDVLVANGGIRFNGGTLRYSAANNIDYSKRINQGQSDAHDGVKIDTNGQNVLFASSIGANYISDPNGFYKFGQGTLSLSAANTYRGPTVASGGVLELLPGGVIPVTSAVSVETGATLRFSRSDTWGNHTATTSAPITVRQGGVLATNNSFNTLVNLNLEGGAFVSLGGGFSNQWPALGLKGTVSVTGNAGFGASFSATAGSFNAINIGPSNAPGFLTLNVAGVSFSNGLAPDLTFNVPLQDQQNATGSSTLASGIIKTGVGVLSMAAANTYTGPTNVTGGVLQISANGGISASSAITLASGTTLRLARSDIWGGHNATSSSPITVNAGATVASQGSFNTLVNPTFAGGTLLLNGGALATFPAFGLKGTVTVSGTQAAQFIAGSGSFNAINIGPSNAAGALIFNVADVTASPAADLTIAVPLQNQQNAAATAALASGLTKTGSGTLSLTAANTYTGLTAITGGTLEIAGAGTLSAASFVDIGAGATLRLSRNDTWGGGSTVAASSGIYVGAGGTLASNNSFNSLVNLNMGGGTLLANGGLNANAPAFYLLGTVGVGGSTASQFVAGTGSFNAIAIGSNLGPGSTTFDVRDATGSSAADLTVAVPLQDVVTAAGRLPSGLVKAGAGTLALTAANTYTGGTTLTRGTISLEHVGALGSTGAITFGSQGVLQYSAANTTDYSARIANSTGAVSIDTNGQNITFASALAASNTGGLTKSGSGTLTLTGNNTSIVYTTIDGGTLQIGNGGAAGAITGGINNQAALVINRTGSLTLSGTILGTGSLSKLGTGTLILTGANNTYAGGTTFSGGVLQVGSAGALGALGALTFAGGTLQYSAANQTDYSARIAQSSSNHYRVDTNGQNVTWAAGLTSGALTKSGAGTLTLSGINSYTGTTTLNAGTLAITNAGNQTLAGNVTGSGSLSKSGAGTLTLSASSTYTGATLVQSGELKLSGSLANSAVTVQAGARLSGNGQVGALTVAGVLAPGNSPGLLTAGPTTFAGGGSYLWEINNALGAAGLGYDTLTVTGALTVGATLANPFTVTLRSLLADNSAGMVSGFDALHNHRFTLVSTSGGILGYAAGSFQVDASGFSNALQGGQWSVATAGNGLDLVFQAAAVPEPQSVAMWLAGLAGLAALGRARRRRA